MAFVFYTLYGHLSRDSLDGLSPGKPVRRGERIAYIGTHEVNGGWPPHLHLQIIGDMLGHGRRLSRCGNARPACGLDQHIAGP